jgi:L-lactate dehydrogenase
MGEGNSKIVIIGAGFVGATIAYTIAQHQLVHEVVLIDVNRDKAKGEAMDISHGLCHMGQMDVHEGDYSDCADSDIVIITAGVNRRPGETRLDLAKRNVPISKSITENIMKYYTRGVILVVSNPVDVLTYLVQKWSGLPNGRVMGTGTGLDSSRFRTLLSQKIGVDIRNVHGYMIGEHGDAMLPMWSATNIAGQTLDETCVAYGIDPLTDEEKEELLSMVKTGGAEVIKKKGATYFAIASVTASICETILKNQNTIKTVSSVINGPQGIYDVALSLPSVVSNMGVTKVLNLKLTEAEQAGLDSCVQKMKSFLAQVQATQYDGLER